MVIKETLGGKVFDYCLIVIMCFLCIIFVYPVLNILAISLSGSTAILRGEVTFYPLDMTFLGYKDVFKNAYIYRAYYNTIYVASVGCITGLTVTAIAAYPIAFSNFYGKKVYTIMIVITMWFSGGLIPTFLVMKNVGLLNSHWALIFNSLCSAYNVIILKSFYNSLPISLIESSRIDGANDLRILSQIVVPLSKPAFATIALWIIVGHWNDFFAPLMYLNDMDKYTLQLILRDIVMSSSGGNYDFSSLVHAGEGTMAIPQQVQNAVVLVSMLPMLIIYPFLQKYFVKGIMLGSVKG